MNLKKNNIIFFLLLLSSNAFSQKRSITPVIPKTIEHTETYKIMEEYGFSTQDYPGEYTQTIIFSDVIYLSQDNGDIIYAYFLVDDGDECFLKKSFVLKSGTSGYGSIMPQEINITNKIKCVLSGYAYDEWKDDYILKQTIMIIDGPNDDENFGDFDIILMYVYDKGLFDIPVTRKELLPIDKGLISNLNEKASDYTSNHPDWKWYIETFE